MVLARFSQQIHFAKKMNSESKRGKEVRVEGGVERMAFMWGVRSGLCSGLAAPRPPSNKSRSEVVSG